VQVLYPGDVVTILPVDGVLHTAIANMTIAEIALKYGVDPFAILDSEYNQLRGSTPDTIPVSGTKIVVPGGVGEQITWQVAVEVEESTGYVRAFALGMAGSCGQVTASGGESWATPLPGGYTFTQGFSLWHSGVDLSVPIGTPVYAANGGPVLFSGWNSWGYGNTVVIGHGPYSTLYGHLDRTAVGCGQYVHTGAIIGYSGSTGNSSGPHLHFEIRYQDTPADPASVLAF
jgi:murein DD-endopeptidase MepM/ murein hydrolase activator NlpD